MGIFSKKSLSKYENLSLLYSSFKMESHLGKEFEELKSPIYVMPWFHNVVDTSLSKKSKKNEIKSKTGNLDYLICEGPKSQKFHDFANSFKGNSDRFAFESKKIFPMQNRASFYTLNSILNIFSPRPVFLGINENIPAGIERELYLCKSIFFAAKALEYNNPCSKIGILIGDSHKESLIHYLNENGLDAIDCFTVGNVPDYFPRQKNYFNEFKELPSLKINMLNALSEFSALS